ncbi:tetratricopeptide repeat protein [Steroidobacter sp.]|uniref:tetratricopeptide repeat protein n=1 Tax=Steroidobacter sp. TaxID=1978227 RepID=UPI001A4DD32F|nr:tetratricopeptide repeat protein [Steroidobacter sp.]MBL8268555.1 tetratricopeptide repeat protein [Steroidobacter sp.]
MRSMRCWSNSALLALAALLSCTTASPAPYIPKDDAVVLARLPASARQAEFQSLRDDVRSRPDDEAAALALAQRYLEVGRAEADPRFISYAQATLTPWLNRPTPPTQALVLQAIAVQYLHRFDEALKLLDRALTQAPDNAQAWVTKASLLQVQGRLSEAKDSCRALLRLTDRMIALTCLTSIDSSLGQLQPSYQRMQALLPALQREPPEVRAWMLLQLSDMALRLGDDKAAEDHAAAALSIDPKNAAAKVAVADLLIDAGQWQAVRDLLRDDADNDVLLLRLAIASRYRGSDANRYAALYESRLDAARQRGDGDAHLREHARFMLDVKGDAAAAVTLAEKNFSKQREPEDVRLLLRAAKASGQWQPATEAIAWIRRHDYQDARVTSTVGERLAATKP